MLNRIITAYRAQIYDWSMKDLWASIKREKALWIAIMGTCLAVIGIAIVGLIINKQWLISVALAVEVVAVIIADRVAVKRYRRALSKRHERLVEVVEFLQATVPDVNLYNQDKIDELIRRLSDYIQERKPFSRIINKMVNFAKNIVIPVIAYMAGLFAVQLQNVEITILVGYGVGIILVAAMVWLAMSVLQDAIRPVLCRDYDAAVSLREDLEDLKLLYFCGKDL